ADEIIEAFNAGIRNFAENKAQDAEKKRLQLPDEIEKEIIWHYVGHLQTNKVSKVVGKFEYIHSVDSFKLANLIAEQATNKGIIQKILIQVNVAKEISKFGFDVFEVEEVFEKILKLDSLNVLGLMTMAPFTDNEEIIRSTFRGLRELRDRLEKKYSCTLKELSMGMSSDYKIAIQEGATMIRLGQILFK
ncbi:MAG: YggS family pyridoxal phosphate-dependent enzyme, partial [Bacteroidota bacterium]|nr:YggS family pyridoxal phosphate-dependent enzyme [Bacteroidota bacterium]